MARTPKHISELTQQIEDLESKAQALREKLPPKVRFAMALKRTRARYKDVGSRQIAKAASAAVHAVRRDDARRGCAVP